MEIKQCIVDTGELKDIEEALRNLWNIKSSVINKGKDDKKKVKKKYTLGR